MARRTGSTRSRPTARTVAATVLTRVLRDQAFAAAALDVELQRAVQLGAPDRRLATELVYGPLRAVAYLQQRLAAHAPRGIDKLDSETRAHLLIAAYQLVCLDRIPPFAAVSEAVSQVTLRRGPQLARFVNALLRKVAAEVEHDGRLPVEEAMRASLDPWLVQRVGAAVQNADRALHVLTAGPFPPPLGLRVSGGQDLDGWAKRIVEAVPHAEVRRGRVSPAALTVRGAGNPTELPGYEQGAWTVQEEGSQVLGFAMGARAGDRVLDACAGRGNKALLLAEQVGFAGCVDAADLHVAKLEVLTARARARGLPLRATFGVDWSVGTADVPADYDRVLVDAPCSGTGTLRRRPELMRRSLQAAVGELQALQVSILKRAASRCRPGGRVVFAVCSILREEAEDVVARVLAEGAPLEPAAFDADLLQSFTVDRTSFRLLPDEHGTDGYFVASFVRKG